MLKMADSDASVSVTPVIVRGANTTNRFDIPLASMVSVPGPGPLIVTVSKIAGRPLDSVIVPLNDERSIVSGPGAPAAQSPDVVSTLAFALATASGREHWPSVTASPLVVFTTMVA